ncbi:MAG: bifunctional transaldolase/phosoglucose isomerase [Candidatus Eremiobacteraeota bacterium]|nr:bifunctional transaldolase/phosoglucose isomerase [Candidatus Eremiobacteraeota bacterium]
MENQLAQLFAAGQSVWLDNLRRNMFTSGELQKLIDQGLRGMTSNPTIFEKAIGAGNDYDQQLASLIGKEHDAGKLFWWLAIADIQSATDLFRPVYDSCAGTDGFVSLEVSPLLAHDTQGTIDMAKDLWQRVDRPNLMIKIPGTTEGVPAITECIAAGININVTLVFSIEMYEATARAYIAGLKKRFEAGQPIAAVSSVNSVFVSRIDTAIDKLLEERIAKGESVQHLLGKAGIANLKLTYQKFAQIFDGADFQQLRAQGAKVQRPLWASTSTKNPEYYDLMYVETVVGKDTVNTMPPNTLDALLDHGKVTPNTVLTDLEGARATMEGLAKAGISIFDVTRKLQIDGVSSFSDSFAALLGAIVYKQKQLANGSQRVRTSLGTHQGAADEALSKLKNDDFLKKLWSKDPSLWSADPAHEKIIKSALGWLDVPQHMVEEVADLRQLGKELSAKFNDVVVLGMGGSSLAPDIMRATFGKIDKFPQLHILDSSDPVQIHELEEKLDLGRTVFIVASKSGTTTEPDAFFRYFFDKVAKTVGAGKAASQFIAITDPGTKLAAEAAADGFLRVFTNDPNIGGRYSALSFFGMVPAALAGYDVELLLDRGLGAMHANDKTVPVTDSPGVIFGTAIGSLAKAGRDKLTIVTHPRIQAFGAWAEQLIAESTGKSGIGIVPVEGEPLGTPQQYGDDRVFVYVGETLAGPDPEDEVKLQALERAGHPVIRMAMNDAYDLGEQFYLWEIATASAGSILGIDAFDQPNVQESKDNTVRLLQEYAQKGSFSDPQPSVTSQNAAVTYLSGTRGGSEGNLTGALSEVLRAIKPGDYVAITAYIARDGIHRELLQTLRTGIRDAFKVATTVGFGPRFLHSTGQLHKGGPNTGVFLQFTADPPYDMQIPGMVKFGLLERAQALGDFESLDKRQRRGARIHIIGKSDEALRAVVHAIDDSLSATV